MEGLALIIIWAFCLSLSYSEELSASWKQAYPNGFGNNTPPAQRNP